MRKGQLGFAKMSRRNFQLGHRISEESEDESLLAGKTHQNEVKPRENDLSESTKNRALNVPSEDSPTTRVEPITMNGNGSPTSGVIVNVRKLHIPPPSDVQFSTFNESDDANDANDDCKKSRDATTKSSSDDNLYFLRVDNTRDRSESPGRRRSSITNVAISSSLAPSLLGAFPGIPQSILHPGVEGQSHAGQLRRSASLDEGGKDPKGRRWSKLPFLRTLYNDSDRESGTDCPTKYHHHNYHHLHHVLPHLHLPTITLTPSDSTAGTGRRFSFGIAIRRHSHTTLHRTDSMVSLCFRTLATYISDDNLAALQNFLDNKRIQVDDRDENNTTALILAASKGKIHFVRELINHGADVNAADGDNWTALLFAAKEGHTNVCLELLEHGADLEHRDMGGWSALMWATYKGRTATVTLLLSRGADVNAHGNFHITSLLWAAGRGHADIVKDLLAHGAKVNVGDKYGTTALIWAARRGNIEIVDTLLKAGATVDTAGMYSWTALLVATLGNHTEVVLLLLEYKPNVNAVDKDGYTALAIACRDGHLEIAKALLHACAYINIQDKAGDTNLIHAVKGGHRGVVDALIKKYVDVDIAGKDKKTATYIAVEKGNVPILKMLLSANPDLESGTKDGDTPLLRAVRSRNGEIVQMLLDKKAKVSTCDKKGDTVLHIAMRARSKAIVEILLRNPKNSQLLYQPNNQGETPYNIDFNHPKTILGQIFGARRLNTNEDNENMLGYDLYSSALADMLSEPSLSTPITVGLYAKWGSGKSFLLNKLRGEMKDFASYWLVPGFQFSSLLFIVITHVSLVIGLILGLIRQSWIEGLLTGASLVAVIYIILGLISYANNRYDWNWPNTVTKELSKKLNSLKLLLQVTFCNPPSSLPNDSMTVQPIKFYFTDQTRVGTTTAGENAVVQMIGSLYDSIENDFGSLATRLYRAFRPKPSKSTATWRWRRTCCLPYAAIFEFCLCSFLVGISMLTVYLIDASSDTPRIDRVSAHIIMISVALLLSAGIIANLYTWSQMLKALIFSQRRHLRRKVARLETLKSEGFLQTLRSEVNLMTEMVKCLDGFTSQQSRLVLIVDGLDSCEQDKVLLVLDAIQALFNDNGCPFVIILAIDPHIIAKAVESNSRRLFTDSEIGGHDYLRNMVHLPFYLQNSGLRKVKTAQQTAHSKKTAWNEAEESVNFTTSNAIHRSVSNRRLSTESGVGVMNSNEKLKPPSRKGSRKIRLSESVASSIGSNLNRLGGAQDLSKMLLTDDYFSDVTPRSMRRLMNVVYITGRLLKAFQIDFNWYHLASWINITEQWPFRTSWMILHYDTSEENFDDTMSLKSLYDKVQPKIPVLREVQPLLELDRDERKLDVFLTFHRSSLLVSDMKIFLPFTINLDPYIKKKIKEEQQTIEEETSQALLKWGVPPTVASNPMWPANRSVLTHRPTTRTAKVAAYPEVQYPQVTNMPTAWPAMRHPIEWQMAPWTQMPPTEVPANRSFSLTTTISSDILDVKLSTLSVEGLCDLLDSIPDLNQSMMYQHKEIIRANNISGRVLLHCDLQELKATLKMSFGDWEIFRMVIISLKEQELTFYTTTHEEGPRSVRFVGPDHSTRKELSLPVSSSRASKSSDMEKGASRTDGPSRREPSKQSIMEKQVTLEEQMICGALQTLNEEACEDVLDLPVTPVAPTDSLAGDHRARSRTSSVSAPDTDYVILQSSPLLHWVPVPDDVDSTDDSSVESLPQIRRSSSQRSIVSNRSGCSINLKNKNKANRPKSLMISPPSSPTSARRSRSTTEENVAASALHSTTSLNEEPTTITIPVPVTGLGKFGKLKDRLLGGGNKTHHHQIDASPKDESDEESTPLVSEVSSPTHSENVFRHQGCVSDSSSDMSPPSMRGGERSVDIDISETVGLVIHESTSNRVSLSRQNAQEWENPETSV